MNWGSAGKHFLLLQGPCGGFYRDLQKALEARGHACTNVVINGGDFVDARLGRKLIFRRSFADWPAWLTATVRREGITDIVLYGDCRPYHRAAMAAVKPLGVAVHVLEEGYLRPNWITCERDGVNGNSRFVDLDLEDIDDAVLDAGEPAPETDFVGSQLRYMLAGINYYFCSLILTPFFPRYEAHRDLDILGEAALWLGRFANWPKRRRETRRALEQIARLGKPVHLVLLQLNGDSQIKDHSGFGSVRHFVEFCIAEFAASGSTDTVLVFKNHPLDNGVINLSKLIRDEAARNGLDGPRFLRRHGQARAAAARGDLGHSRQFHRLPPVVAPRYSDPGSWQGCLQSSGNCAAHAPGGFFPHAARGAACAL